MLSSKDTTDDIELESQPKPHDVAQQEISIPGNVNSLQQLEDIPKEYLNINQVCCEICAYLVHFFMCLNNYIICYHISNTMLFIYYYHILLSFFKHGAVCTLSSL